MDLVKVLPPPLLPLPLIRYNKNPGVTRDPHGPREDSGCISTVDPGVSLVEQMYNYVKQYHPSTRIMATAIRTKDDAMALSGLDYLVVPQKVCLGHIFGFILRSQQFFIYLICGKKNVFLSSP